MSSGPPAARAAKALATRLLAGDAAAAETSVRVGLAPPHPYLPPLAARRRSAASVKRSTHVLPKALSLAYPAASPWPIAELRWDSGTPSQK